MPRRLVSVLLLLLLLLPAAGDASAALMLTTASSTANSIARTPTITGNAWVALFIIAAFVGTIYMLIAGALHVERRDAKLGRGRSRSDDGWFGIFPAQAPDDEDSPDYQHVNGDGGDGGEGGG